MCLLQNKQERKQTKTKTNSKMKPTFEAHTHTMIRRRAHPFLVLLGVYILWSFQHTSLSNHILIDCFIQRLFRLIGRFCLFLSLSLLSSLRCRSFVRVQCAVVPLVLRRCLEK